MYYIGLLLIKITVCVEVDCHDGNRGGCSHTCYKNICKCPPCWELDATGLDCVPAQNKVSVIYSDKCLSIEGKNNLLLVWNGSVSRSVRISR